jgi:predicted transcriptional regulator
MVNTEAFMDAVKESGMTFSEVAKKMGFSYRSLYRKARNKTIFRISEVEMFCKIVKVTTKSGKELIFLP